MSAVAIKELRERTGLGLLECKRALANSSGDVEKAIEALRKSSGIKAAKKAGRVAADGIVAGKVSNEGDFAILVEVNSETDFVARDIGFLEFVTNVVEKAFKLKTDDVSRVLDAGLEKDRQALVQKIGENVNVRRIALLNIEEGVAGIYVHSNSRIGVLIGLSNENSQLLKDVAMHVAALNPKVIAAEDMPQQIIDKEREIYVAQALDSGKSEEITNKMVSGRLKKFLAENSLLEQAFVKDQDKTVGELVSECGSQILSFIRYEVGEGIDAEKIDFAEEVAAQLKH